MTSGACPQISYIYIKADIILFDMAHVPRLVLFSDGSPGFIGGNAAVNLADIPQPPGGTDQDGTTACRTRSWWTGLDVRKIPLSDQYTLLSTATRYNNLEQSNVATSFPSGSAKAADGYLNHATWGTYGLPSGGEMGVSVAGQSIFPVFADSVDLTPQKCEVDQCNEHVGQGGGAPHLHGDPFGSVCLYDATNYTDANGNQDLTVHPPVIGFSLDGPTIYGRYLSTSAPGYSTALDDCGGHLHDSYPYHYHTSVKAAKGNSACADKSQGNCENTEYPAFPPGPDKCWKVNIAALQNANGNFWTKPTDKRDEVLPCCSMTEYWSQTGISFNGAGTNSYTPTGAPATSSSTSTSTGTRASQATVPVTVVCFAFGVLMYMQ